MTLPLDARDRLLRARSLREQEPAQGFKLARALAQPDAGPDHRGAQALDAAAAQRSDAGQTAGTGPSKAYYRNRVSQILFKLLSDTRVHHVGTGPRGLDGQRHALREAARGISLGGDLRLSEVLATDMAEMDELARRIAARGTWPKGRRPHGVLAFVAECIEGDTLFAVGGGRIAVRGTISVFGPGRGARRRGPFIVAVLVASPDGHQPLAPLEAYAQRDGHQLLGVIGHRSVGRTDAWCMRGEVARPTFGQGAEPGAIVAKTTRFAAWERRRFTANCADFLYGVVDSIRGAHGANRIGDSDRGRRWCWFSELEFRDAGKCECHDGTEHRHGGRGGPSPMQPRPRL